MKGGRLILVFAALSLAGTVLAYFHLPETIPLHWDYSGRIDNWGPRWSILLLGALPLATALLMRALPRIDPKRDSYRKHEKTYEVIQVIVVLMLAGVSWISVASGLGVPMDVGVLVRILIGVSFIGLGNFMGRLKRNYFVGIKTPWALADDEVWRRTHRCGGWVFVGMGAAFLVSLAVPPGPALGVVTLVPTIGGVVFLFLYSWLQWRKLRGDEWPGSRGGIS